MEQTSDPLPHGTCFPGIFPIPRPSAGRLIIDRLPPPSARATPRHRLLCCSSTKKKRGRKSRILSTAGPLKEPSPSFLASYRDSLSLLDTGHFGTLELHCVQWSAVQGHGHSMILMKRLILTGSCPSFCLSNRRRISLCRSG